MNLFVITPTYNEAENINLLLPSLAKIYAENNIPGGVIVVDDGSPDGTAGIVRDLSTKLQTASFTIVLIERSGKLGLGSAYIAGFKKAFEIGADAILQMDADLSHDPLKLPEFYEALGTSDVVIGSRYVPGGGVKNWPLYRKLISRTGSLYSRLILGWKVADATGGFNGWKVNTLKSIDIDSVSSTGYAFLIELKYRAFCKGFKIREIPITFVDRIYGVSKMSVGIVKEAIRQVLRLRLTIPRE